MATTPSLQDIPATLHPLLTEYWQSLSAAAQEHQVNLDLTPQQIGSLFRVFAASDFVAKACIREPALLAELVQSGDLANRYPTGEYPRRLEAVLRDATTEADLGTALRRIRRREMVRIAWRDLAGMADLYEVLGDLSDLADACVACAVDKLHAWQQAELGTPVDEDGNPQSLVVIAMGKLGARELNFSSDIDLIFTYPSDGVTRDGPRQVDNSRYFIRLAQRLIAALDTQTAEGYVFRTDARLRPFGNAGQLAISFDAMEEYYQNHGREWERYAMVKARTITGDPDQGAALMRTLQPFVYRRYLDFNVFESLREMKALIAREVANKGMEDNVKLGPGGIREVEFIGQTFQLIRGGREPRLRERSILAVLRNLEDLELLPAYVVENLTTAYVFLRRVENRIQAFADRQTHAIPGGDQERLRLAVAMGYDDWAALNAHLRHHMRVVHEHFDQVFAAPQGEEQPAKAPGAAPDLAAVWQGGLAEETVLAVLAQAGYDDPAAAWRLINQTRDGSHYRTLSPNGRRRMDRLMPLLLGAVAATDNPDTCLARIVRVLEAIARRTAYLALLVEHPMALSQLARLCGASPWIAELLGRHPVLLDELLDPRTLYAPLDKAELEAELTARLEAAGEADTEQQLEVLRQFQQANVLRVAAADVAGVMPLMVVSDHLTDIAETLLRQVVELAARHLIERHGRPRCTVEGVPAEPGFGVIAYGKLGGIELGYGSDLDLVFLHDSRGEAQYTDGAKSIDNALFFSRLGQRIIHFLTAHTPAGVLYDVDTRLRPSGAAGFLVSGVESFAAYQREQAWTWEHQALVRARFVAGDAAVGTQFEAVRRETLGRARDPEKLREEVREMRRRMRAELSKGKTVRFDLKQDPGGIADIEFLVQYGVLRWAHDHPELLTYTDNIRQLDGLTAAKLMTADDAAALADAYRAYRKRVHQLTLQQQPAVVEEAEFAEERRRVGAIWQRWMEAELVNGDF